MLRLVALTSVLLINYLPSVLACDGCKEPSSVAGGSGVGGISASFSWSVVFMLGVLGFLLTGMLFMIIQSCKQLAAAQQNPAAEPMGETVGNTSQVADVSWCHAKEHRLPGCDFAPSQLA